ncbi:ankyrin repeat-containing domain protein [Pestalotiopsis sp. NC0098]|nr:ankyrin repeat-containing domain protein [Pestalotiopsis sp. NC0098]
MTDAFYDMFIAINEGNLPVVQRAVEAAPPPPEDVLELAAAAAIREHRLDIFRYLLEKGVSATSGRVVYGACRAKILEIFQIMFDHGWQAEHINADMVHIQFMSPAMSSRSAVEWLLDHGMDPNLPGEKGLFRLRGKSTPMNLMAARGAIHKDVIEILELLLSRGATFDPFVLENAMARRGKPGYQLEVLQWLVDHGANVDYPLEGGFNIIHRAVANRDRDLVEFLLRNGADTTVRRAIDGKSPLDVARKLEAREICDIIEKHQSGLADSAN